MQLLLVVMIIRLLAEREMMNSRSVFIQDIQLTAAITLFFLMVKLVMIFCAEFLEAKMV